MLRGSVLLPTSLRPPCAFEGTTARSAAASRAASIRSSASCRRSAPRCSRASHYADLKEAKASPVEANVSLAPTKRLYLLSEKKGEQVYDESGQKIGEIRELALDPKARRVSFVVLSIGGYLGSGDKLVAVPWEALSTIPDANNPKLLRTLLATTPERLREAPEFRAGAEAKPFEDPEWVLSVYQFYSVRPYWSSRPQTETGGAK